VAAFDVEPDEPDESGDLAYRLMVSSFVSLFWRREVLEEAVRWLAGHDYDVVRLDAASWMTEDDLHTDVASALDFPDHYGRNLDALGDCLRGVAAYAYGTSRTAAGLAIVLTGYDSFATRFPGQAWHLLDLIAARAREAMLIGHRMLGLVQTDDPDRSFAPVGATPVMWNPAEWVAANRHPAE
jgi:hypothetical protein